MLGVVRCARCICTIKQNKSGRMEPYQIAWVTVTWSVCGVVWGERVSVWRRRMGGGGAEGICTDDH